MLLVYSGNNISLHNMDKLTGWLQDFLCDDKTRIKISAKTDCHKGIILLSIKLRLHKKCKKNIPRIDPNLEWEIR